MTLWPPNMAAVTNNEIHPTASALDLPADYAGVPGVANCHEASNKSRNSSSTLR